MLQILRFTLAGLVAILLVAGPVAYYQFRRAETRNFRVVEAGVLYRSGQMNLSGLKKVIHDHRIKTVITLRAADGPGASHPDSHEEEFCRSKEIHYYRIPPGGWLPQNGINPADGRVKKFLEIMNDPRHHPVLVHCFAGQHRTGAYCAIFRMECQGWSSADAIEEMVRNGYDLLDEHTDVRSYLTQFQPGVILRKKSANLEWPDLPRP
jgi:tyrosine-protein phosphatase SIW14